MRKMMNEAKKYSAFSLVIIICLLMTAKTSFAQKTNPPVSASPTGIGLLNGKATNLVNPVYPETAKKSALGGAVRVDVTIDEKGNVISADAVSGEMLLRDAALAAARASKFTPNLVKGKPSKMSGFIVFNFIAPKKADDDFFSMPGMDDLLKSAEQNRVRREKAKMLASEGGYEEAVKILTALIDDGFMDSPDLQTRAGVYLKMKKYDPALKDINLSIEYSGKNASAEQYILQGDIYLADDNDVEAVKSYTKAVEKEPKRTEGYLARGYVYMREDVDELKLADYDLALADFNKILEINPKNIDALNARGYVYANQNKKAEAIADFRKVLDLDPDDQLAKYNLDAILRNKKVVTAEEFKEVNKTIYYV